MRKTLIAAATILVAAGCDVEPNPEDPATVDDSAATAMGGTDAATESPIATAVLRDTAGNEVARARIVRRGQGAPSLVLEASHIAPGAHGIHIHEVGRCDAEDQFASAGGHLNPTGAAHGLENAAGPHAGDMPNLEVADDSTATARHQLEALASAGDTTALFDSNGSALVIHAGEDDQRTDPSGDSGDRIACGVIQQG